MSMLGGRSASPGRLVATAAILCVVAGVAAFGITHVRVAGPLALAPLAAVGVWWLAVALLANRLWDLAPDDRRPAVVRHLARIVALALGNLILLDLLLYAVLFVARTLAAFESTSVISFGLMALAAQERFVAAMIYRLLGFTVLLIATLVIVRNLATVARELGIEAVAARLGAGAVLVLVVAECWYTLALNVAGLLPLPAVVHHTSVAEIGSVRLPMGLASMTTVGVRSWRPTGGVVRVVLKSTDELASARLTVGQPVVVTTRSLGFSKVALVEGVGLDSDAGVPALVAAMPSAEWPRKWLIGSLVRETRWNEAVAQLREYRRYYPRDDETVRRVVFSLRQGNQAALARAVEGEFLR
ncbi:MAG TPA: hypothetical protein VK548_04325 [Candidatus Acidoferrum sp.]|nr:hypothetical protein [Candidatus Acidoferrum sp.]